MSLAMPAGLPFIVAYRAIWLVSTCHTYRIKSLVPFTVHEL